MSKFTKFDEAILSAIRAGRDTFKELWREDIKEMTQPFMNSDIREQGWRDDWRILDCRLQVLRKSGRIVFSKGKWIVSPKLSTKG